MRHKPWYVVSLLATLYVISYIDRLILALLVEPIKADLGLTDVQMGLLIGPAFAVLFAIIGLPVAWLVDRGNRKLLVVVGVVLWSICTMLAGYATSFAMLFVLRMGLAIGESVLSPAAISLIGDLFRRRDRSAPSAFFVASGTTGVMLAYVVGAAAIDLASSGALRGLPLIGHLPPWRLSLVLIALPGLLLALIALLTITEPQRGTKEEAAPTVPTIDHADGGSVASPHGIFESAREAFAYYFFFFVGNAMLGLMLYGTLAWYPTHLIRTQGVTASEAGYIFSSALAGGVLLTLTIPILAERISRIGRRDLLLFIPVVQIPIGLLLFVAALLQTDLMAASILMAFGFSLLTSINALPSISISLTAPPAMRGRLAAIVQLCNNIISLSIGSYLVALLGKTVFPGPAGIGTALLAIALITGPIAWAMFFLAWRPYARAMKRLAI